MPGDAMNANDVGPACIFPVQIAGTKTSACALAAPTARGDYITQPWNAWCDAYAAEPVNSPACKS